MKDDYEGRWKKEEEENSRLSLSSSSSVHADILDSGTAEKMSQQHYKLGVKSKWCAHLADWSDHADWSHTSEESSALPIPPWRDKSLWRITTTKIVEGLMSEQPSRGVKQKFESQYEALSKKHAMEDAKLMKEYEEMKASENGFNEEDETKDKGWKNKIEEIPSLMKEMTGRISEQKLKGNLETVQQEVSQSQGNGKKIEEETEEQCVSASHNFGTVEYEVPQSHGIKRKTDEAQEAVGQHLSGSQRSEKKMRPKERVRKISRRRKSGGTKVKDQLRRRMTRRGGLSNV